VHINITKNDIDIYLNTLLFNLYITANIHISIIDDTKNNINEYLNIVPNGNQKSFGLLKNINNGSNKNNIKQNVIIVTYTGQASLKNFFIK
jgi:hypothetical protein